MFQPLDYMFLIMIGLWLVYAAYSFWDNNIRVKAVKDDLIERYVILQRTYESRR